MDARAHLQRVIDRPKRRRRRAVVAAVWLALTFLAAGMTAGFIRASREAEPHLERALEIRERLLPTNHPSLAVSLNNLGALYENTARYAQAEPLYRRSLSIYLKILEPEHPELRALIEEFAAMLRETGRQDEAAELEARLPAPP